MPTVAMLVKGWPLQCRSLRALCRDGLWCARGCGRLPRVRGGHHRRLRCPVRGGEGTRIAIGVLWRLRRATTMETGLFEIQADQLSGFRQARQIHPPDGQSRSLCAIIGNHKRNRSGAQLSAEPVEPAVDPTVALAPCFLRLANLPNYALDRLNRYEGTLWRQARDCPAEC
jgi:hypothetical protein